MAWRCSGRTNAELVANLFKNGLITSERVRDAMIRVDRAHFCPVVSAAYSDSPQPLPNSSATISAPHMHASAAESLLPYLRPGSRVLDIGSGSGYLTAVLAELVTSCVVDLAGGPGDARRGGGKVVGLEHIESLRRLGQENVARGARGRELLGAGTVVFVMGDGRKGWIDEEEEEEGEGRGWDAIHVGAAATEIHAALVEQLRSPGRMFIPVEDQQGYGDQDIWVVDKDGNGRVTKQKLYGVRYVPLTDAPA